MGNRVKTTCQEVSLDTAKCNFPRSKSNRNKKVSEKCKETCGLCATSQRTQTPSANTVPVTTPTYAPVTSIVTPAVAPTLVLTPAVIECEDSTENFSIIIN